MPLYNRFRLDLRMNNAAFEESSGSEVARILRELADKLDDGELERGEVHTLFDSNGNSVGAADCYGARR